MLEDGQDELRELRRAGVRLRMDDAGKRRASILRQHLGERCGVLLLPGEDERRPMTCACDALQLGGDPRQVRACEFVDVPLEPPLLPRLRVPVPPWLLLGEIGDLLEPTRAELVDLTPLAPDGAVLALFNRRRPLIAARVVRTVERMEFKRRQLAPGLKVTSKAFGSGRRLPIVAQVRLQLQPMGVSRAAIRAGADAGARARRDDRRLPPPEEE